VTDARSKLSDGYTDIPPGKLVNVVVCMEMFAPPAARPEPKREDLSLVRFNDPDPASYRALFRRVGAPYLWSSRLELADALLSKLLNDPNVEPYVVRSADAELGMMELDFTPDECELRFFGLVERALGTGTGRWLMNRTIERAWSRPIRRFWLHTCHFDHPAAIGFYLRSGFRPYKRQIEIYDDPRLTGLLPVDAAPQVPIIR
jgi:GNAT superfamily N-acetyltransferase